MSSFSLDARFVSSPLAALSMVATSSLEGRDLFYMASDGDGNHHGYAASAPVSHAGTAPSSPSVGPAHMDDLGYHHQRKRKCLAVEDASSVPERTWSPKARSPLSQTAAADAGENHGERLSSVLPVAPWSESTGPNAVRDENPYPSPRLPAILPAPAANANSDYQRHQQRQHQSNALASLLNPADVSSPSLGPTSPHGNQELYAPSATRMPYSNGPSSVSSDIIRPSASPSPSSPGRDTVYGNESPRRPDSVDGGSRPATPTSTAHLTPDERRRRRLERNRLAARECRQKKKVYVQELEDRMERMEGENRRLRKEIEELNAKLTLGSMHLDRRGMFESRADTNQNGVSASSDVSSIADQSMESPAAQLSLGGRSAPTPPPSNGSFVLQHSVDMMKRELSASPTLPGPVVSPSRGRPHSDSWSSV